MLLAGPLVLFLAGVSKPGEPSGDGLTPQVAAAPEYPIVSMYGGIGNQIYCKAVINARGEVESIAEWTGVVTLPGSDYYRAVRADFREAVTQALEQWRFPEGPPARELVLEFDFQFRYSDRSAGVWSRYVKPNRVVIVAHRMPREVVE